MVMVTTHAVPPRDRFEYWRELIRQRTSLCFRMQPVTGPAHCALRAETIGDLALLHLHGGVVKRYTRTRAEISRSQVPFYFAHIQLEGDCTVRRGEQEIRLRRGDAFIIDPRHEFEMELSRSRTTLVARIPREWLSGRVSRPDRVHGAVLRGRRPFARLMMGYLFNGFEIASRLPAETSVVFSRHAAELTAHALKETWAENPAPSTAWREAMFVRACRTIALRSADPQLTPHTIACKLGISTRLLQRIFAERGETVMKHVFGERVDRSAELLLTRDAAHRSITDIALSCGFNDSAHFTRVFAARMGMTPSRWRRIDTSREPAAGRNLRGCDTILGISAHQDRTKV